MNLSRVVGGGDPSGARQKLPCDPAHADRGAGRRLFSRFRRLPVLWFADCQNRLLVDAASQQSPRAGGSLIEHRGQERLDPDDVGTGPASE